jgi:tetratricopeptide (TPR) repeat protein
MLNPVGAPDRHLLLATMARLLDGIPDPEELRREVLPHLLSLCPECVESLEHLRDLVRVYGHWSHVDALHEWPAAGEMWLSLKELSAAEQVAAVECDEQYQTWGMCRLLQRMSRDEARQRPRWAHELAGLAVLISLRLDEGYDLTWVNGLRAVCLACLGNARRALGELGGALEAFAAARELLEADFGNPAFEAEVLTLEALLDRDRHRLEEAIARLERAREIYTGADHEVADDHLAGSTQAHQGWCLHHMGRHAEALAHLDEARRLLHGDRAPQLTVAVHLGRLWCAVALGRIGDAKEPLDAAITAVARWGGERDELQLRRAQARIAREAAREEAREEGHHGAEIRGTLEGVTAGLIRLGMGFDAALAMLDLADLLLLQRDDEAIARLAGAMPTVAAARDIGREAMRELLRFERICEEGRLGRELVRVVAVRLETLRRPSVSWWSAWRTRLDDETETDVGPST